MAFVVPKPFSRATVNGLGEYQKYGKNIRISLFQNMQTNNDDEYKKFLLMSDTEKSAYMDELEKKEMERLALIVLNSSELDKAQILSDLKEQLNGDEARAKTLMSEFSYVGNNLITAQKQAANQQEPVIKPPSPSKKQPMGLFQLFKKKEEKIESIPEEVLLSPVQKSYLLKKVAKYNEDLPLETKRAIILGIITATALTLLALVVGRNIEIDDILGFIMNLLLTTGLFAVTANAFIDKIMAITDIRTNRKVLEKVLEELGADPLISNETKENTEGGLKQ